MLSGRTRWGGERRASTQRCAVTALASVIGLAAEAAATSGLPCHYEVETYQQGCAWPFPDSPTHGNGIASNGMVAGDYRDCATAEGDHAFLWPPGADGIQVIPYPPGVDHMNPHDISDAGWVVGVIGYGDLASHAFLHKDGVTTDLGVLPGGEMSESHAVANDGTVVGYSTSTFWGPVRLEAFVWREGAMTGLAASLGTADSVAYDVSENGLVTGWAGATISSARAFVTEGDRATFLPLPQGAMSSRGYAITSQGNVCGRYTTTAGHAFAYLNGALIALSELPGANSSIAYDLNDALIVGDSGSKDGVRGVVWTPDGQVRNVNDLIARESNVIVKHVRAISSDGIITGYGESQITYTTVAVRLTPVWPGLADLNCDGLVNGFDLALLLGMWGECGSGRSCAGDLNTDRVINGIDVAILLGQW